jgi:hypothetical protein
VNDSTFIVVGDYFVQDSLMQKAIVMKMNVNGNVEWTNYTGQNGNYSLNDVTINNNIIREMAKKVSLDRLDCLKERKDKIVSRLFMKKLELLLEKEKNYLQKLFGQAFPLTIN